MPNAIADFDQVIRLQPDFGWGYEGRGLALLMIGELQRAAADFDRSLRLSPEMVSTLGYRCIVRARLGQLGSGLPDCAHARQLVGDYAGGNSWPWIAEAGVHLLAGDQVATRRAIADSPRHRPDTALGFALQSILLQREGRSTEAEADWRRATELDGEIAAELRAWFGDDLWHGLGAETRPGGVR